MCLSVLRLKHDPQCEGGGSGAQYQVGSALWPQKGQGQVSCKGALPTRFY